MFIEPITISWILLASASFCAFMIGKLSGNNDRETAIEDTLQYLINEGFVKARTTPDGEIELIHPDDK